MSSEDATYEVTELGNAVYHAFLEAYRKKHPELTEEEALRGLREGKP
jgi:hypothetical protein